MIAFSFLNPLLLWGGALASIPLIIHILNRRRFKRVEWAAMEFLLRAFKKNRKRVRFEQILLLLLRMALVALLALLLSRPRASSDDMLGLSKRTAHHIVLVDDSGSMGATLGAGSSMSEAKARIRALANKLGESRTGDLFTLIRTSRDAPELSSRPVTTALEAEVQERLAELSETPDRLRLGPALGRVAKFARASMDLTDRINLYLVSDLRKGDLMAAGGKLEEGIIKQFRAFPQDRLRVHILPVGGPIPQNLAVAELRLREARSVKGQASSFVVTVRNPGGTVSAECELRFLVDGAASTTRTIPSLAGGETRSEIFRTSFATAGSHYVEAILPKDRLSIDNRKALAFPVAESSNVLLVDGDPGSRVELAETFYLGIALDPTEDSSAGVLVTKADTQEMQEMQLQSFDVVVLANVTQVEDEELRILEDYVRKGGGLLLFTGDQIDPGIWNRTLYKDGQGLAPAPLRDVAGDIEGNKEAIVVSDKGHEMFQGAGEQFSQLLGLVNVGRYHTLGLDTPGWDGQLPEGSKVLLRVGDERGPPLALERGFGEGRVMMFTTTSDASWHSWPSNPSYLVVMRGAIDYLMRREDLSPMNLGGRGVLRKALSPVEFARDVRMLPATEQQDSRIPERSFLASVSKDDSEVLDLVVAPLKGQSWPAAGCYRLELTRLDGGKENSYFSVSPWDKEGRPEILNRKDFMGALPQELAEKVQWLDRDAMSESRFLSDEGEIWRFLAFVLIGFLFLETLLAWRFGHH